MLVFKLKFHEKKSGPYNKLPFYMEKKFESKTKKTYFCLNKVVFVFICLG